MEWCPCGQAHHLPGTPPAGGMRAAGLGRTGSSSGCGCGCRRRRRRCCKEHAGLTAHVDDLNNHAPARLSAEGVITARAQGGALETSAWRKPLAHTVRIPLVRCNVRTQVAPAHHWIFTQRPQLKPLLNADEPTPIYAACGRSWDGRGTLLGSGAVGPSRRAGLRPQLKGALHTCLYSTR